MGIIVKPNNFAASTPAVASQVNANFDVIYNAFNGNIDSNNLATNSVVTSKIADNNVTTAKINDSAVTTAKINNLAVTTDKIADSAVGVSRLAAVESTDLFNGTSITASTWTDFKGNQNFTVDNANSTILVSINGRASMGAAAGAAGNLSSRIVIDSAGTPITRSIGGGGASATSSNYFNPFQSGGFVIITGLSAGTHTIKTQVYASFASCVLYCRCSTLPDIEFFSTNVLELKK